MIVAGIDEAGRGPVVGALVIAGVSVKEENLEKLKNIGVKDSKLLTRKQREALFDKIENICEEVKIVIIPPSEIDRAILVEEELNLNWLEAIKSAEIIDSFSKVDKVILDCPSTNIRAYTNYLKNKIERKVEVKCEHKADFKYEAVSAASIIAKVTRDNEIDKIKKKIKEDFGSGYPSDPVTQQFLRKNYLKFPDIFRKSWESYKRLIDNKKQKSLKEF